MIHLGDITKIKGYEAPTVDCIIGGSPCQDLSLAGKRAGLAGARSGLYMEQIRIIKEMREYDRSNGRTGVDIRPRYMVWENVPGAFSTNKGEDFAAVLEEAIRVAEPEAPSVPVPEKGWPTSGCIVGGQWSVAWRVLDAQFWGTSDKPLPQRRRRIALVADFGGLSAPEILFVRQSVSGNLEPGKPKGKEAPRDVGESSGGAVGGAFGCDTYNYTVTGDTACTLNSNSCITSSRVGPTVAQPVGCDLYNLALSGDKAVSLNTNANATGAGPTVIAVDQGGGKSGANSYEDVSPTLTCTHGGEPAVVYGISPYHSNCMKSDNPHSGYYEADTARSLDAMNCGYPGCNQGGMAVVQPVTVCLEGNGSRPSHKGDGYIESDTMYTLNTIERHGVAYSMETYQKVTGPLMANSHPGSYTGQDAFSDMLVAGPVLKDPIVIDRAFFNQGQNAQFEPQCYEDGTVPTLISRGPCAVAHGVDCRNATEYEDQTGTLQAKSNGGISYNCNNVVRVKHIVRRLTPLECERLQGFPDGWTDIGEWVDTKGKKHKEADSPRYKALGNSIAIPPWKWVLKRLCACYERDATMASLFDGIGGFPYIWEQINGKGSCLWASEIEEFPIAVTKLRFGGTDNG